MFKDGLAPFCVDDRGNLQHQLHPGKCVLHLMTGKRGRPLGGDSDDVEVNRRRQELRERMRRLRLQRKAPSAAHVQLPAKHLQRGECIVNLSTIEDGETLITLLVTRPDVQLSELV